MSPTGSALVALQNKMQTPMVIKPAERKAKSNGLAWAIGIGAVLLTLLACATLWFIMAQDDGADIIMFSDVLQISPKN